MCFSVNAHAEKSDFQGTWKGNISGLPVEVKIWAYVNYEVENLNATIIVGASPETAQVLGYKPASDALYMFRKSDKAPFAMYRVNGVMYLEYWEAKGTARKTIMVK